MCHTTRLKLIRVRGVGDNGRGGTCPGGSDQVGPGQAGAGAGGRVAGQVGAGRGPSLGFVHLPSNLEGKGWRLQPRPGATTTTTTATYYLYKKQCHFNDRQYGSCFFPNPAIPPALVRLESTTRKGGGQDTYKVASR